MVFLSSDGNYGIACSNDGNGIYYSNTESGSGTSVGQNWTQSNINTGGLLTGNFNYATLSSDGKYGIAGGSSNNGLYYTTDYGKTWTQSSNITTGNFYSIALSIVSNSSGKSYIAGIAGGASNNGIYYTNNLTPGTYVGQTWTQSTLNPNPNSN
jgi:photosystem II stability/assembly factor-like uncharacterized protein